MDLIILHDGLYHLIPVNVELIANHIWKDCFDLCDIVRDKITIYNEDINKHVLQNGSFFFGCVCN
tara:strand:+ start:102 stop:296 length:195 start_codon:yes stop_codon:yes gene_type:complete